MSRDTPVRVAVIGGGAAGMFFCHAVEKHRKLKAPIDLVVTCFEKASTPGGIWKSAEASVADEKLLQKNGDSNDANDESLTTEKTATTRIYDELWTNGPSHNLEFYDYTFDEHFDGQRPPVYFPRKDVAEYLFGRVTKDSPTFLQDYFQFGKEVLKVTFDNNVQQFELTVRDVATEESSIQTFDKCIWACGENGHGVIPDSLLELFSPETYKHKTETSPIGVTESLPPNVTDVSTGALLGVHSNVESKTLPLLLHSTETDLMKENVPGRRVLLIGGGFSAEDLALQCVKWGAGHVDVVARDDESPVNWTTRWPNGKVEVHGLFEVQSVDKNPKGTWNVQFQKVERAWPAGYEPAEPEDDEDEDDMVMSLENIDIVVCCTGYKPNLSMLDETLQKEGGIPAWYMGQDESMHFTVPEGWKMDTSHRVHKYTGDVPAGQGRMIRGAMCHPNTHRGICLANPNMMFLSEHGFDVPLMALDVHAWLLASYLTGRVPMPSSEELRKANYDELIATLDVPIARYSLDEGYAQALDGIEEEGFWPEDDSEDCDWWQLEFDYTKYSLRLLAKIMAEGQYPGKSPGTFEALNDTGNLLYDFDIASYNMRDAREDDKKSARWRTFRDDPVRAESIFSLYTGTKARKLKKRWLDAVGPVSVRAGDV